MRNDRRALRAGVPSSASRRLAVVGLTLACALAASPTAPARADTRALPSGDPFYTYTGATPLEQIAPGTVLNTRPIRFAPSGSATLFDGEQLLYRTTGEQGQPTATVTTILEPLLPLLGDKIVSWQTAYDALGSECDPSYTLTGGNPGYATAQSEATLMQGYLAAGMTVVVPDYEGTNLEWGAGQESGYGTLDGVRAAESWLGVAASTPVAMVGYSGGSIATEWASELAPSYAPGLNIVGVAEGGIPVDFAHNLAYVNGSQGWSGVIPAVLTGVSRAFGVPLNPYLSAYGQKVLAQVGPECINDFFGSYPGLTIQQLLKPQYQNFLAIPTFARIINRLIMGTSPGRPSSPLLMAVGDSDGTGDGVMVAADVEALAHEYCQEGVPVNFTVFNGSDHGAAAIPFEVSALTFVVSRFAGLPPVNGCGSIGSGNSLAPLPVVAGAGCPLASCTSAPECERRAPRGTSRDAARTWAWSRSGKAAWFRSGSPTAGSPGRR